MSQIELLECLIHHPNVFAVDPDRGFLPSPDPLDRLPAVFEPWERIAAELPKLLVASRVRQVVNQLRVIDTEPGDDRQVRRAMVLLSFLGHAYVWGEAKPIDRVPAGLAVPWYQVAQRLGRPPVLSYASYCLDNWRRLDPAGPIALGNIVLRQNFLGGVDEEWFILVHVDIEAKAAAALHAIPRAQQAVAEEDETALELHLVTIAQALEEMNATLLRMPERCDPYVYFNRVRPYIHGWKDHPELPSGLIYEGVAAYRGQPQQFRGETGAQSSIVPSLDAALGVAHKQDPLRTYLQEMRDYMPGEHRAFIAAIEEGPSIRERVLEWRHRSSTLRDVYNTCVTRLEQFRSKHLEYASTYIHKQAQRRSSNPVDVGTGGTPFMRYLKKHRDETTSHTIS